MELTIKEVEIAKLNLTPGDTLVVKVRGDDFDHAETLESLRTSLRQAFPLNRIMVFSMGKDHDLEMTVMKHYIEGESNESNSGTEGGTEGTV